MGIIRIHFQHDMSHEEFLVLYGTVAQCEDAWAEARWPRGYYCPRCEATKASRTANGRRLWECLLCGYQCSLIAGTVLEATKLPLTKWFLAMFLLTRSQNSVAALELMRQLGVSYKTAWLVKHRLLEDMGQHEAMRLLTGGV